MLGIIFMSTIEALQGRKWAPLVAHQTGEFVSERTVRNWMTGKNQPTTIQINTLKKACFQNLRTVLPKKGWSNDEIEKYLVHADQTQGIIGAFVHSMSAQNDYIYKNTFNLSTQIDELAIHLWAFRKADQIIPFIKLLQNTAWIETHHYINPEQEISTPENIHKQLANAKHWQDLKYPFNVITLNLVMQLLARLDLEFCSRYMEGFIATPVFQLLMPRIASGAVPDENGQYKKTRDLFHFPTRRLLELIACLRYFYIHRRWPEKLPSVHEMSAWMGSTSTDIIKWRMGRQFTLRDFENVWQAMFRHVPEKRCPALPMPLVFASTLLTCLYVKGSREQRNLEMTLPNSEIYLKWWRIEKERLQLPPDGLVFGKEPWMPLLS